MNPTQRAVDAAVDFIRRFRRGATRVTASVDGHRLGDDVADAVPPGRADAGPTGPEYELDYEAAGMLPPASAAGDVPDAMLAPTPSPWTPEARVAAGGAAVGLAGAGMSSLFEDAPAVTIGGTAELAAEVPPLVVADDAPVATPTKPAASGGPSKGRPPVPGGASNDPDGRPSLPPADGLRQAVGRGSLYQEEADLLAREAEIEKSATELGMPQQYTLPQHMRDAAAGNDMVGRFRFVHSPTGLRAVDTSATPAEKHAQFMRWANSEPGSETQARYNPAGAAQWDAKVAGQISKWAQDDLAISADPVLGPQRKAAEQQAFRDRIARRDFLEKDPRTQKIRGEREADLARREGNRRMLQQNPFLTLGDPSLNEWQKFVLSQNMLRGSDPKVTDPNAVQATHNDQALELMKRFTNGQGFQQPMTPDQLRLLGIQVQQKEAELPAAVQADSYRDKPGVHQSEEQMVDDYVSQRYSTPGSWVGLGGLSSPFTPDEQAKVVAWLVNEKNYTPEKAKLLVDSIAGKRNTQSWFSN
jgi:hypothetical protein